MATAAPSIRAPKRRNPDRIFYPVMCGLVLLSVWFGFSKTYYAVGMVHAKLPSALVHVHAVVMTLWLVTLVVQIGLVSARKVKLHMALGLWGFGLAAVMVPLGLIAGRDSMRRGVSPPGSGLSALTFFVIPVTDIVLFGVLVGLSYLRRRRPQEHKRLIMIGTLTILDAAVARFPIMFGPIGVPALTGILFGLLLMMVVYDAVTLRKVLPVTWVSVATVIVVMLVRVPLAQTHAWMQFAAMVRG